MTENGSDGRETGPEDVAAYISVMTAEMVRMARAHKLGALAYLLELARLEAVDRSQPAGEQSKRIA
ncbi:MAG: hypothetical protein KF794_08190 [Xanthobacteraceae bacterium]|nr:hypothetical protein [Xanthobacteraceae bacterium]QYK43792.1 MAG: hypothetical protein KF794_08190 [Xanthobacteraceae bacterium]